MAFPDAYISIIKEENINDGGYIQLEWNDTESEPLSVGTECPIDSNYILFSKYYPNQSAAGRFRYNPKFMHRLYQLDFLPFYFNTEAVTGVDGSGNVTYEDVVLSTYPYTGNISTIANALADCLNDHGDLGEWTADTSGLSNSVIKSINFDGATIKSAAKAIADAYGVDYYFIWSTRTIKFGNFDAEGVEPSYGTTAMSENGVTETTDKLVSASDGGVQYNTFRVLGGTKNMSKKTVRGQNVQVTQRLMLDENDSIIDTRPAGSNLPKIMKDIVFDDIFPKMELWMYDVHERRCYLTDENGKKIIDSQTIDPETGGTITTYKQFSKWYFKLARWNGTELVPYVFNTNLIIEGLKLAMEFQPNYEDNALPQPLVGREFELTYFDAANPATEVDENDVNDSGYQPVHGEYRIIFKVEGNMILPSTSEENIRPYGDSMSLANNKVTLTNVAMDSIYEQAAKVELRTAALDAIDTYVRDKSSFTYNTYGAGPTLGGVASGGIVTSVRRNLITGEVQYTVGDYKSSKGLIGRLSDKIDTAGVTGGGASTNDSSNKGGGVSETSIPLLSRLMGSGNVVKDTLTVLRELILGTNGHGIFIDQRGDASMTIGALTVLGTTHLNEIDVNHVRHTGGMMVVTKANLIVDSYEVLEGNLWRLYYRRRDGNGQTIHNLFEIGDFALMMTYNEGLSGSVNRYFWRQVVDAGIKMETVTDETTGETSSVETDLGYVTLNYGSFNTVPKDGDVVVQLGNISVEERQGATVLGGSGSNGGFFAIYEGISSIGVAAPNLDDYNNALIYLSPKKNKLTGNFVSTSGNDLQSQLDALRASLASITQQSDRQLVIWYGDDDTPYPTSGHLNEYNTPAKDWHDADVLAGNTDQQELHLEDVYYLRRNNTTRTGGRAWQWIYDEYLEQFLWLEITDVDVIAALEAADDAVATANDAKEKVLNLADDGIISAGTEKSELLVQWQDTVAEYVKLIEQAEDYDLDDAEDTGEGANLVRTPFHNYQDKYGLLAIMLNGGSTTNINSIKTGSMLPAWLQSLNVDSVLSDYNLTASQYRNTWQGYFEARSNLYKAIEAAAKAKTQDAQDTADQAHARLNNIADDGKLDPTEKVIVRREFVEAWRERDSQGGLIDRCYDANNNPLNDTIVSGFLNPYKNAFLTIANYLNGSNGNWTDTEYPVVNVDDYIPLWLNIERKDTTETLTGATVNSTSLSGGDYWRHIWSAFYSARTALLTALSDDAKDRADTAQDTADQKKRVFQTNANELPPAPYSVGDLWMNAIWYTETTVNGVVNRTYKWSGDQLICTQARNTNASRSINDWVDAASGVTAKIAQLGDQILAEVANRKSGTSTALHLDETTGGIYVRKYNSSNDTWTTIGQISLALVKEGNNDYYSKLNLTADNVEMNASLINVVAQTIKAKAELLDFQGGTVKIDASNIGFKVGDTTFDLESGVAKLLINSMVGIHGKDAPTGCKNSSWSDSPINATSSYPYMWMRIQTYENNAVVSTTYMRLKTGSDTGKGVRVQFTASIATTPSGAAIHDSWQSGDNYMRMKGDDDSSWGDWFMVVGETGEKRYSFNISTSASLASGESATQVLQQQIGMVIRKETNEAAGEFSFGTYVGGVFKQGLKFETDNGNSKLVLAADTTVVKSDFKVDAQNNIDFNGKTISLNASSVLAISGGTVNLKGTTVQMDADNMQIDSGSLVLTGKTIGITGGTINLSATSTLNLTSANLSINADQLTYSGRTIDLTAATISLNADQLTYSGRTIDLTAATLTLNADQLTYSGRSIDLTAANLTLNAGQLTYSGQTIDLTAATVSLGADQITFAGKTIALGTTQSKVTINGGDIQVASNKTLKFSSGSIDFTGSTVTMSGDNISFSATNSFKAAVGNSGVVLSEDLISAFIEDVASTDGQALSSKMGLVISRGYASNNFGFGYYTYNSSTQQYDWAGGLNFEVATEDSFKKTRLILTADTAKINADALILDGKTVSISASKTFTVSSSGELSLSGGTIEIEGSASVTIKSGSSMTLNAGSTLNLTAANVNLNAGQLNYQGEFINLAVANISLGADQITFEGKTVTISANKTLTFTSGTVGSGQTKGTIDFTGAKINMNADQLTFVGKTVINGKFSVDGSGNVTMDGFTATNATITGAITATSGSFNGTLTIPADDGTFTYAKNNAFGLYMNSGAAFTSGRADYLYGYTQRGAILRIEQITATSSFRGIYGNCEVEIQGITQLLRTPSKINDETVFALIVEGIDNKKMTKTVGIKNSGKRIVNVKETSSTSYSVGDSDEKIVLTRSGDQSVTLPSNPEDGREIWMRNKNGGTVSVSASHTMVGDNPSSFTAVEYWHIYTFYNGTWYYGYTQ